MFVRLFLFFLNFYFVLSNPFLTLRDAGAASECQNACHPLNDKKVNVHFVPHSHDDVGWLKTYEQYYKGNDEPGRSIDEAGVRHILSSVVKALGANKDRRFIYVETAFFFKWWNDQTDEVKKTVKNLVQSGQLEIINGGWSMNDEATTNYQSIIDQFTWGFRILEDTVGECGRPKIGWQIDPFGHSREHASIVKQLGFEGLVVGRIDYNDKAQRITDKNLDFIWNTNDNFEEDDAKLFTTMFPNFYTYEYGFCFDIFSADCNDPNITDENLKAKVKEFKDILIKYKDYYQTNNILIPMGHDFSYQQAEQNFQNIDKLIDGFKDDDTFNVIYSTPSCYIKAVKEEVENKSISLTIKTDDFFPYADNIHSYWTGYFTSRPTSKRFERVGNNILQSAKQLTTFSRIQGKDDDVKINDLRMAMGVFQHHDAITGTEKQAVANDYSHLLYDAIQEIEEPISGIISDLLKKENTTIDLKLTNCLRTNVSVCEITSEQDKFLVAVQNPLSKTVSHYVRLPVDGENYKITGLEDDGEIAFDIFDTIHSFDYIKDGAPANKELVFLAKDLPPLGVKLYYVEKSEDAGSAYHKFADIGENKMFGNETVNSFTIDDKGKLTAITIKGKKLNIQQDFYYYEGSVGTGTDNDEEQASGAYVFRPDGSAIQISENVSTVQFAQGSLVEEVRQVFSEEITQIIRVYKAAEEPYIEFDWLVGNLKVDDKGKEVITRFTVNEDGFENKEIFYTDSNGRQQIKRHRNKRNDYSYTYSDEPIASNYYPVTSKIVIKDEAKDLQIAVLNDRAQGGSSLKEGVVELMIHRRDVKDDGFGVDEILSESQADMGLYARGQHYLTFGNIAKESTATERYLAHKKLRAPVVLVGDATGEDLALDKVQASFNFKFEALKKDLPENVQILTLEPWDNNYILRLEHIFEKEDGDFSKDATVDLKDLFTLFNITELTEKKLGANQDLATQSSQSLLAKYVKTPRADESLSVTLKAMEIKTFVFKTDKNNDGGDSGVKPIEDDNDDDNNSGEMFRSVSFLVVLMSSLYLLF